MMTVITAMWLVFENSHASIGSRLEQMAAISTLPLVVVGPLAGVVTDKFARRRILHTGQWLRVVLCLALTVGISARSHVVMLAIYAIQLCTNRVLYNVRAASVRHLVRKHEIVAADSLMLLVGPIVGAPSAAVAVAMFNWLGLPVVVLMMILHLAAAKKFTSISVPLGGGNEHRSAALRETMRLLRRSKARYAIVATSLHRLIFGSTYVAVAVLLEANHLDTSVALAAVVSAAGLGTFLGSLTAEFVNELFPRRTFSVVAFAVSATAACVAAYVGSVPLVLAYACIAAFVFQNLRICTDATVLATATQGAGGREFAAYDVSYNLSFVLGIVIAVRLCQEAGPTTLLVFASVLFACGSALVGRLPRDDSSQANRIEQPSASSRGFLRSRAVSRFSLIE